MLQRYIAHGRTAALAGLAAIVIVTSLSSLYYGIYFLLLGLGWVTLASIGARRAIPFERVRGLALAAGTVVALLSPVLLAYLSFARSEGFHYPLSEYADHSSSVAGFFQPVTWLWLWQGIAPAGSSGWFPGFVLLGLTWFAVSNRDAADAPPVFALGLLALACVVFSFGPVLKVFDYPTLGGRVWMPGRLLMIIPGLRMPARWLSCALVPMIPLLAFGVDSASRRFKASHQRLAVGCLLALAMMESWPTERFVTDLAHPGDPIARSSAYRWLHDTRPAGASVELPSEDSTGFRNAIMSGYVYGAVAHGQPVVSYYASHWLPLLDQLQDAAERLPADDARAMLSRKGVKRVILHRELMGVSAYTVRVRQLRNAGYSVEFEGSDAAVFGWH